MDASSFIVSSSSRLVPAAPARSHSSTPLSHTLAPALVRAEPSTSRVDKDALERSSAGGATSRCGALLRRVVPRTLRRGTPSQVENDITKGTHKAVPIKDNDDELVITLEADAHESLYESGDKDDSVRAGKHASPPPPYSPLAAGDGQADTALGHMHEPAGVEEDLLVVTFGGADLVCPSRRHDVVKQTGSAASAKSQRDTKPLKSKRGQTSAPNGDKKVVRWSEFEERQDDCARLLEADRRMAAQLRSFGI